MKVALLLRQLVPKRILDQADSWAFLDDLGTEQAHHKLCFSKLARTRWCGPGTCGLVALPLIDSSG